MVDMPPISGEDGLVFQESAGNRQRQIQQGNTQHKHQKRGVEGGDPVAGPYDSEAAQQEAGQEGAGIAEKDRSRVEIEKKEAQ